MATSAVGRERASWLLAESQNRISCSNGCHEAVLHLYRLVWCIFRAFPLCVHGVLRDAQSYAAVNST